MILTACGGGGGGSDIVQVQGQSSYKLSVSSSAPSTGPSGSITITATVNTPGGAPAAGQTLQFSLSSGAPGSLSATSAVTNSSGQATVTLNGAGGSGSGNVNVKLTDTSNNIATSSVPFTVTNGNGLLLSASTTTVKSGSGTSNAVVISATVADSQGGALAGQNVTFAISGSQNGSFSSASTVTTNSSGVATINYLPSTVDRSNKQVTITATTTSSSGSTTSATIVITISGTNIQLSAPQTNLTVGASSTVTAVLQDGSGAAIAGQTIIFTSVALSSPVTMTTDSNGKASVNITAPSSAPNNQVVVSANADGASASYTFSLSTTSFKFLQPAASAQVAVSGSCTIRPANTTVVPNVPAGQPSSTPNGYPTICTAEPTNASPTQVQLSFTQNGSPVADGTVIYFATTLGSFFTPDAQGGFDAASTASAKTVGGVASIDLASRYAGGATIQANTADGSQQASTTVSFIAGNPTQISAQAASTAVAPSASTQITATVRDTIGNPVQGQVVTFNKTADDSNGSLSAAAATTDANGQASVTFNAGSISGATDGVQITATVQQFPSVVGTAELTVGGQAVFVSIGTGNTLASQDTVTYAMPYNVIVTNAAGQPVANQAVSLSVYPVSYFKGDYFQIGNSWVAMDSTGTTSPVECPNEDLNLNGILDPTEDNDAGSFFGPSSYPGSGDVIDNGNHKLEPGNPATLSQGSVVTNASGEATFNVLYGKSYASWLKLKLVASTQVAGSESSATRVFVTSATTADLTPPNAPPGGIPSPFGTNTSCFIPN